MSRAPRQAQTKSGGDAPGTEARDVPEGRGHQLDRESAERTAQALTAAGWPVPPDIEAALDAPQDPIPAPVTAADEPSEA